MYQLNLTKEEFEFLEQAVCNGYNKMVTGKKLADIGLKLKQVLPLDDALAKKMTEASDDFNKDFTVVSSLHDKLHDLKPIESNSILSADDTIKVEDKQFKPTYAPFIKETDDIADRLYMDSTKTPISPVTNILTENDKQPLIRVYGMLSVYANTLSINDVSLQRKAKDAEDAKDYILNLTKRI